MTYGARARTSLLVAMLAVLAAVASSCDPVPPRPSDPEPPIHLNQVQVVGSHNSYKVEASPEESAIRRQVIGDLEDQMLYTHAPLGEQLAEQAVRQIELDVFRDPAGGLYANPLIRAAAGHGAYDPAMQAPGTKVLHVQDVDYRSTCLSFVACLQAVKAWSDAHPHHMPIAILVELKDSPLTVGDITFTTPLPWDGPSLDGLDAEIRSVFPADRIIEPDDVRQGHDTLDEAVTTDGWPLLTSVRGQVLFLMDNGGGYRTAYRQGHPVLQGRPMFTNANPGDPDAAFVKRNDPVGHEVEIQALVEQGYVVRTRADADTEQARSGDTTMRDAAFASGAQWVSTDYPVLGPEYAERWGTTFVVQVPGGTVARCNPVNAAEDCDSRFIDNASVAP